MNKAKKTDQLLKHFFILIILVFSLGQLQRLQVTPDIAVYAHDLLIFGWLTIFAANRRQHLKKYFETAVFWFSSRPVISGLLFWILAGMGFQQVLTGFSEITPVLYLLRAAIYVLFAVATRTILRPYYLRTFWTTAGLLVLIFGLLQYILLPDMRFLFIFGWDDHYYRMISTLFDPAFTGMVLVMSFAYFYSLNFYSVKEVHYLDLLQRDAAKILTLILISVGIMLTYSRSSMLALGVMVIMLIAMAFRKIGSSKLWKRRFVLTALLLPPIMLGIYLAAPKPGGAGVNLQRTETAYARIDNSILALNRLSLKTLLIGEGLFTPTVSSTSIIGINHAHIPDNLFIMLLTALGLPGLLLFIYGMYYLGKETYHRDKILFSAYMSLLVHAQFNNTLLQPFVLLFLLGGISSMNRPLSNGIEQ